jgi:hypothetical protein
MRDTVFYSENPEGDKGVDVMVTLKWMLDK